MDTMTWATIALWIIASFFLVLTLVLLFVGIPVALDVKRTIRRVQGTIDEVRVKADPILFKAQEVASDIQDINVHGLNHYLSHPAVNSVIINTLVGVEAVRKKDVSEALAMWRQDRLKGSDLTLVKGQLRNLLGARADKWLDIVNMLVDLRTLVLDESTLRDGEG